MQFPLPTFCSRVYFYSWPLLMPTFFEYCDESETSNPAGSSYHLVLRPPSSYRDCTCSGVVPLLFPVLSSARPQISSLFDVSSCASTKFAVKLEAFITRARKRTRAPSENENNRKRNKFSNFADQSSLPMLVNFSPLSLAFLFFHVQGLWLRSGIVLERAAGITRNRIFLLANVSLELCRDGWKEGIRVTKFIPVFPPSARNTVLYIYIWLGGEIKTRVFNLIIAFTKRKFEEDKPLNYYIEETKVG